MAIPAALDDFSPAPAAFDVGQNIGMLGVDDTLRSLPDSWPYLLPSWLQRTEDVLSTAYPWSSVARRGKDIAVLPAFRFDRPGLVDCDPRTYLGWRPSSGETACCGVASACCDDTVSAVDALGLDPFFPALVLGSPLGYRSEGGSTDGDLLAELVTRVVAEARASGIRCVVAPWVPDRDVNAPLLDALRREGGSISFWGDENHLPLEHGSYDEHLAALPARKRRRVKEDYDRAAASGVTVRRVDREALRPAVGRIAQLTCMNRQKHDGDENPAHIESLLHGLIDDGADVRAYLGSLDGRLVASCVTIRHCERMIIKWAGFDYAALGERSGVYFTLVLDLPLRDAYAEGLRSVEVGPGADQAKRLRGCRPRRIDTALLFLGDDDPNPLLAQLQADFGRQRSEALGAEPPKRERPTLLRRSPKSSDCCG